MPAKRAAGKPKSSIRFESVKLDALFEVLDAVAWLPGPSTKDISQFADIDPRTAGKILKNARLIGLVETPSRNGFRMKLSVKRRRAMLASNPIEE